MLTTFTVDTAGITHKYTTDETVNGISSFLYFKLKFKPITVKVQATLAQMSENLTMLGGYAVNEIIDTTKNTVGYTPMNVFSIWTDIHSNGVKWEFGLFAGYTKNNGFETNIVTKKSLWTWWQYRSCIQNSSTCCIQTGQDAFCSGSGKYSCCLR